MCFVDDTEDKEQLFPVPVLLCIFPINVFIMHRPTDEQFPCNHVYKQRDILLQNERKQ